MTPQDSSLPPCYFCGSTCPVEYGYCHCFCGNVAPIAKRTKSKLQHRKGFPTKYISGHNTAQRDPRILGGDPFKIEGVYCRLIGLTQGQYTIVWDRDYEMLMQWKWCACWSPKGQTFYVWRGLVVSGRHFTVQMARIILGLDPDDPRDGDHVNGVTLDNRWINLRAANSSQSVINQKVKITNKSGAKGVHWHKRNKKWAPTISIWGEKVYLGEFDSFEEAVAVREAAEKKYHGEFARAK